jgi:hypothetical protein
VIAFDRPAGGDLPDSKGLVERVKTGYRNLFVGTWPILLRPTVVISRIPV